MKRIIAELDPRGWHQDTPIVIIGIGLVLFFIFCPVEP